MKISLNWGFWIVVSFCLFAAGIFTMVYISMSTNEDLVTDNYYEKELKYQDHIELVKSSNALEQRVDMEFTGMSVIFHFPNIGNKVHYSGSIYFFRPSDKRGDFVRDIEIDSTNSQSFPAESFAKGFWRAKITWAAGNQNYYSELPFIIH